MARSVEQILKAFVAVLGMYALTTAAAAQQFNDYPTVVRADYVFGCMKANGDSRESLERCSCSIDIIASILPYERYEVAESFMSIGQISSEMGALYRDSEPARQATDALNQARAEAQMRCF